MLFESQCISQEFTQLMLCIVCCFMCKVLCLVNALLFLPSYLTLFLKRLRLFHCCCQMQVATFFVC